MFRDALDKGKALVDKIASAVMNYTELENKVRDATSDEPWGPHGGLMREISRETRHYQGLCEVMNMLWERIFPENTRHWRRIYKGLTLLAFLLRNGSEDVVKNAQEHLYDLRTLEGYKCIDERGRDQGASVRVKAAEVIELIQDSEFLQAEREKALADSKHYGGFCNTNPNYTFRRSSNYDEYEANPHMVSEEIFTFPEPADDALQPASGSPESPPTSDRHPYAKPPDRLQASLGHSLPKDKPAAATVPAKSEEAPSMLIDLSPGDSNAPSHSIQTTAKLPRPPSAELLTAIPSSSGITTQPMTSDLFVDFNGFAAQPTAPATSSSNMGLANFSSPTPLETQQPTTSSLADADFGEFTSAQFDAAAPANQSFASTKSAASQPFVNLDFSPQPQSTTSLPSNRPLVANQTASSATTTSTPITVPTMPKTSKPEKPALGRLWQDFDSLSLDLDLRHKNAPAKPSAPSLRQLQNQKMTGSLQTSSTAKLPQASVGTGMSATPKPAPGSNLNDLSFFE
uniref:ENTH domain-containing protein n=1 Tax=Schistocephalus solidus TaxID=70667 RepID=A0A0X3PJQ2_SCHSO